MSRPSQGVVAAVAPAATSTHQNINKVEEMIEANRKIEELIKEGGPTTTNPSQNNAGTLTSSNNAIASSSNSNNNQEVVHLANEQKP